MAKREMVSIPPSACSVCGGSGRKNGRTCEHCEGEGDEPGSGGGWVVAQRVGRPRRGKSVADAPVTIRLTKTERAAWDRARGELSLSDWIRARCNAAARVR